MRTMRPGVRIPAFRAIALALALAFHAASAFALTPAQLTALATEITTDPRGYGYAAQVELGSDTGVATLLNEPRAEITVNRGFILPEQLANAIVFAEYTGGQAAPRQYIDMLMGLPRIDLSPNSNPRNALTSIFVAGSQTRANIVAASQKTPASRAEELFGVNTIVNDTDVQKALRP